MRLAPALCQAEHPHGSLGPVQKGYVFQWFCNDLQGNAPKGGRGRRGAGRVPRSGARPQNMSCRINRFILQLTFPRPGPLQHALPAAYPLRPPPALRSAIPCKNHWFFKPFQPGAGHAPWDLRLARGRRRAQRASWPNLQNLIKPRFVTFLAASDHMNSFKMLRNLWN